jgi:23S rRNA (uracil1939-C5)-methyltransferase
VTTPPTLKSGMTTTARIESLFHDGRGVFHSGTRRVLTRGAWPGDEVELSVYRRRKGNLEARVTEVLHQGACRRDAPCEHLDECGGCSWQQWPVDEQRRMKQILVRQAFAQTADELADPESPGPIDVEVLPTLEVGPEYGYRNKMEFSFGTDRETGSTMLGLHRTGRFDWTFDLGRCYIAGPVVSDIVGRVRDWARRQGHSAYSQRSHEGLLRHLVVREAAATGEVMVVLVASSTDVGGLTELAEGLPSAVPRVASLLLGVNAREGDTALAETTTLLAGRDTIREQIGDVEVDVSWRSFLQTNSVGAAHLYDLVAARAALTGTERVLDLYCGTGLIGFCLAPMADTVVGLEQTPEAIGDAERTCERLGLTNVSFVNGLAEKVLPLWRASGETFDLAVVDPPRAGMHPNALAALVGLQPTAIVYVSCNPRTLSADMKVLVEAGYTPGPVQPLDMFPQTAHVESVVRLDHRAPR